MHGVVVIDKPAGMTSHDVVASIRRVLRIQKIGHAGTLDPIATGVLPVCINEATKLMPFFENHRKEYVATMRLGVRTDTLDREGRILSAQNPSVSSQEVADSLAQFVGSIKQIPPRYSAIKMRGRPLYAWTRQGISMEPPARTVMIYGIMPERIDPPDAVFRVSCGKGVYIRTLCADAGERLGCGAILAELRRTASGPFTEDAALRLTGHPPALQKQMLEEGLISLTDALPEMPAIEVDVSAAAQLRVGRQPTAATMRLSDNPFLAAGDVVKCITVEKELVAVARALMSAGEMATADPELQTFEILRVFNETKTA